MMKMLPIFISLFCFATVQSDAQSPMLCSIKGRIVQILKPGKDDGSPCVKQPCRAKVKILHIHTCGSAIIHPLHEGGIIEVTFAYTLHATKKLFPRMKPVYPGLKNGSVFSAEIEQRIRPDKEDFVVYGYKTE